MLGVQLEQIKGQCVEIKRERKNALCDLFWTKTHSLSMHIEELSIGWSDPNGTSVLLSFPQGLKNIIKDEAITFQEPT